MQRHLKKFYIFIFSINSHIYSYMQFYRKYNIQLSNFSSTPFYLKAWPVQWSYIDLQNTELSRNTFQVSADWGHREIVKKLHSEAVLSSCAAQNSSICWDYRAKLHRRRHDNSNALYRNEGARNTHKSCHTEIHRHTQGSLMCTGRRQSIWCLCFSARDAEEREVGGGGGEMGGFDGERKGKHKRRMKANVEKHQLRTTAAGEPDRARRERRETILEQGKQRKRHWQNGGVG